MKNGYKILIGTCGTILCFLFIFFYFFMPAIKDLNYETLSNKEFISYMEKMGCKVSNSLDKKKDSKLISKYSTIPGSCSFEATYLTSNDIDASYSYYANYYNKLDDDVTINFDIEEDNYEAFSSSFKDEVYAVYNNGTVLYFKGSNNMRDKIDKMVRDLGYDYTYYETIYSLIAAMCFIILQLVPWYFLNKKMGREGIIMIAPIYNYICLSKDVFGTWYYAILAFFPFTVIIFYDLVFYKIGACFGKDMKFRILSFLFPYIFIPILAFDDSKYLGPGKKFI